MTEQLDYAISLPRVVRYVRLYLSCRTYERIVQAPLLSCQLSAVAPAPKSESRSTDVFTLADTSPIASSTSARRLVSGMSILPCAFALLRFRFADCTTRDHSDRDLGTCGGPRMAAISLLYSQSGIQARSGVALASSMPLDGVGRSAKLRNRLVHALEHHVMGGAALHADEPLASPRTWRRLRRHRHNPDLFTRRASGWLQGAAGRAVPLHARMPAERIG